MDCLKSFSVSVSGNSNLTAPDVDFWGAAPQNYWKARLGFGTPSQFDIQGFKNINIYRIKAVGSVISTINSGNGCIVNDWIWILRVFGQNQNIGGNVISTSGTFGLNIPNTNPYIYLDKYNRSIEYKDPILSCSAFQVVYLQAAGIGAENLTSLNLRWEVTFVIDYAFQDE